MLVNGPSRIRVPADLRRARVLFETPRDAWRRWFDAAGIDGPEMDAGASFNDASLALQAAVDGQGVALGRLTLAADDLCSGRLIQPFDVVLPNDYSYWLVYQRSSISKPQVAAFRSWLLSEASASASGGSFIG
jgi:LysR family glycine cleavage system transcriptional activator